MEARALKAELADEEKTSQLQSYREREADDALLQLRNIVGNWHDVRIWGGHLHRVQDDGTLVIEPENEGGLPTPVELAFVEYTDLEPFAGQAQDFVKRICSNQRLVVVERLGGKTGAFVFLWNVDGSIVLNRALLSEGLAECDATASGVRFDAIDTALKLREAQENARSTQSGIWIKR